ETLTPPDVEMDVQPIVNFFQRTETVRYELLPQSPILPITPVQFYRLLPSGCVRCPGPLKQGHHLLPWRYDPICVLEEFLVQFRGLAWLSLRFEGQDFCKTGAATLQWLDH